MTDTQLIIELTKENRKFRDALKFIANWKLPQSTYQDWTLVNAGRAKEPTQVTCTYEVAHGSNGVRDYIKASREIKFKVWQGKRKSFFFLRLLEWLLYRPENSLGELPEISGDSDIQQSTGLKDSNGKEIYEGDILTYDRKRNDRDWNWDGCYYFIVKLENGMFVVDTIERPLYEVINHEDIFFKVAGNIFENPELLK